MSARVGVVILNYEAAAATLACVAVLGDRPDVDIIVVDNGSSPECRQRLRAELPPGCELLQLPHNGGYAAGNNAGLRLGLERGYDLLLLLNDDARLRPEVLQRLVTSMRAEVGLGMLNPVLLDAAGKVWFAGGRLSRTWNALHCGRDAAPPPPGPVLDSDFATGACLLVRSRMLREVGLLEESFFLYCEDVEWSLRARQSGWRVGFDPGAQAVHLEASASGRGERRKAYYLARNRWRVVREFASRQRRAGLCALVLAETLRQSAVLVATGRGDVARCSWRGLLDAWRGRRGRGPVV